MTLRDRLRHDLHDDHVALDTLVSLFDLTTRAGLIRFLSMQANGLSDLGEDIAGPSGPVVRDLRQRALHDLSTLGAPVPSPSRDVMTLDALAVDYVIGGSRLGTQVLRRRWASATDPSVRGATAYFGGPSHIELWRGFCEAAAMIPADTPDADRIVSDARALFARYTLHASQGVAPRSLERV